VKPLLDIDGNGTADARTDGSLLLRYLFGTRGDGLLGTMGPGATRTTAGAIEAYLALGFQAISFTSTPPANATVGGPTYNVAATSTSGLR
jgi:hypothetical protein